MKLIAVVLVASCVGLVSCAHTPSQGDKMLHVSNHAKALSEQWNEGHRLVVEGNDLIVNGKKMIAKGEDMLAVGRRQVAEGLRLQRDSEHRFSEKFPDAASEH